MTAMDVIDEIKRLPADERLKVMEFTHATDSKWLSPSELTVIAEKMINASTPEEAARFEEMYIKGFYGTKRDA